MDRSAFFMGSHEEVKQRQREQMRAMTPSERLAHAWDLTRRAYGEDLSEKIRMDRTVFSMRKQPD